MSPLIIDDPTPDDSPDVEPMAGDAPPLVDVPLPLPDDDLGPCGPSCCRSPS